MNTIACPPEILARTIEVLQSGGKRSEERVVLWLASVSASRKPIPIVEVYEPQQITNLDYFKLPPESLRVLMSYLRAARLKIMAQVHSHPRNAFHSKADNDWAVIRHVGALSLVLPRFARQTTVQNFLEEAVTYELSTQNEWVCVPNHGADCRIGVLS